MEANNHIWASYLSGLALAYLLAGCSGGGTAPATDEDNQQATVTGTVTIEDAPLADLDDESEIGEQDADKWALRVIDPTESLDSVTLPHTDTTIIMTELVPITDALLEVEILPALDLTGGTASVTPVQLDISLPLTASATTVVDTTISFLEPLSASTAHLAQQSSGYSIQLTYTVQHGSTTASTLLELDWNGQQLRRDTDGDGNLDDETYFADLDHNGLSSNYQRGLDDQRTQGAAFTETGSVTTVDVAAGTLQLGQRAYIIDETTVIIDAIGSIITLDDISIDQQLSISGRRGQSGSRYALTIDVLDS